MAFIFGGNTPWTYETLKKKREIADALLMANSSTPKNVGEGLNAIGRALTVRGINRKADKRDAELKGEFEAQYNAAFGGYGSGGGVPMASPQGGGSPTFSQPTPTSQRDPNSPDAVAADTMSALGKINPADREILAKTIMAEAGGEGYGGMLAAGAVMDNRRKGGGYGDGWEGVLMKPGQFSAWNSVTGYAGGEGGLNMSSMTPSEEAYAAADAILTGNYEDPTGGATHYYNPNVADPKWGAKAGGQWTPIGNHVFGFADAGRSGGQPSPQGGGSPAPQGGGMPQGMDLGTLASLAANPYATEGQKAVINALMEQQMKAMDPMY
ncbi:MAG: cell wall hydrolase, partial [Beijerinckiaceae bacterium]